MIHLYIEDCPPGRKFQLELWNQETKIPIRLTRNKDQKWAIKNCFEDVSPDELDAWGNGIPNLQVMIYITKKAPFGKKNVNLNRDASGRVVCDTTERKTEEIGDYVTVGTITLSACTPVPLVIRVYEYGHLDRYRKDYGYYRVGDVCFSELELNESTSKPVYSAPDMYYMENDPKLHQGQEYIYNDADAPVKFKGYFRILAKCEGDIGREDHPYELIEEVASSMIEKERHLLKEKTAHLSVYSKQFRSQSISPESYFIPGMPSFGPHEYMYTAQSFFYYQPIITPGWLEKSTRQVIRSRGLTDDAFMEMVARVTTQGTDVTPEFTECLHIAHHVVRLFTCARTYVPDHAWFDYKNGKQGIVCGDQETMPTGLPGDCEDSTCLSYMILMTILLEIWTDYPLCHALQKCAAMLGVPVAVSGTFADPEKEHARGDTGHFYGAIIPFVTFGRMTGLDLSERFEETYGFKMPAYHQKPVILEAVFRTTMFYSDHNGVDKGKKTDLEKIKQWLAKKQEDREDVWCWRNYSVESVTDKNHRAHGHAFRAFTDFLVQWNMGTCRSFIIEAGLEGPLTTEDLNALFPNNNSGKIRKDRKGLEIFDSVIQQSIPGWGVAVELLGCGHQEYKGNPVIRLQPTGIDTDTDRVLREMYDRPIVKLHPDMTDHFQRRVPDGDLPHESEGLPHKDSNKRITIYAHNVDENKLNRDMKELGDQIGSHTYWIGKYAFGYVVVFTRAKKNG